MSDNYQAIYDATRSRLSNCDVGAAVGDAARSQLSGLDQSIQLVRQEYEIAAMEHRTTALMAQRPFMLLRPSMMQDGNMWCALYGDNIQDGVAGFGETPEKAAEDFDKNWRTQTLGAAP